MDAKDAAILRREARRNGDLSNGAVRLLGEVIDLHLLESGCFASDGKLSEWLCTTRRTVRRWRNELQEAGYLRVKRTAKRHLVPCSPSEEDRTELSNADKSVRTKMSDPDKNVQEGVDKNVQHREYNNNSVRDVEYGGGDSSPLPDDHPVRWDYFEGDWRWHAGIYCLSQLSAHNCLNSHYRKRLVSGEHPGKIASEWADTFRLLVEQDGWKKEEVAITMKWLFETENWWRENRVVQSVGALRKKDDEGTTKFDKILQSALADYEQRQSEQVDTEEIRRGWRGDGASRPTNGAVTAEPGVDGESFQWAT